MVLRRRARTVQFMLKICFVVDEFSLKFLKDFNTEGTETTEVCTSHESPVTPSVPLRP